MQKYTNDVVAVGLDGNLTPLSNASVTVYNNGTSTLATIYTDNGITTTPNPTTTSVTGRVEFYADDGRYDILISKTGYNNVFIRDILFDDPNIISVRSAPAFFGSDITPSNHLKQFSNRLSGGGAGALPGNVTVSAGAVTAIAVSAGGSNYSTNSTRVLIVGDGTGAAATATISSGVITGFTVTAGGTGYTSATAFVVDGPVVVLVGDSISSENPNQSVDGSSFWNVLTSEIRSNNLKRNITFFNRAIGAQTWTSFNGVANANLPSWYTSPTKAWIEYIKELQPDLVVVAFGMNDRENFVFAQMNAAITKLLSFTTAPDIILATTMVPSASSTNIDISGSVAQNGRDATSGYIRGKALVNNFGFLDLNRRSRLVRDGLDVRACALQNHITNQTNTIPWTATQTSQSDFYLLATFSSVLNWTGQTLTFPLGTTGPNTVTELLLDDSSGKVRVTVRDRQGGVGTSIQEQVVSTLTSPTGTVSINLIVVDSTLQVIVNNTSIYSKTIARFSGEFYPSISAAVSWGSASITYSGGKYAQYAPRATDLELWGDSGLGYGGNTFNHPSSIGVALMIAPVVSEANWNSFPISIGDTTSALSTNVGIGTQDPLARLHVAKTPMAVPTSPSAVSNTLLLSDASASGLSIMTDDPGACRIFMGDASNPDRYQLNWANSVDQFTEVVAGVTHRTATSSVQIYGVPLRLPSYTVAGVPSAVTAAAGAIVYISNESGGAVIAFSDGTNWRRVTDRAIIT